MATTVGAPVQMVGAADTAKGSNRVAGDARATGTSAAGGAAATATTTGATGTAATATATRITATCSTATAATATGGGNSGRLPPPAGQLGAGLPAPPEAGVVRHRGAGLAAGGWPRGAGGRCRRCRGRPAPSSLSCGRATWTFSCDEPGLPRHAIPRPAGRGGQPRDTPEATIAAASRSGRCAATAPRPTPCCRGPRGPRPPCRPGPGGTPPPPLPPPRRRGRVLPPLAGRRQLPRRRGPGGPRLRRASAWQARSPETYVRIIVRWEIVCLEWSDYF